MKAERGLIDGRSTLLARVPATKRRNASAVDSSSNAAHPRLAGVVCQAN